MAERLDILASAKTVGGVNVLTIQAKSNMQEGKAEASISIKGTN